MHFAPRKFCSLLLAVGLLAPFSRAETLRLRADPWMPYNGAPAAKAPGFGIEIARAIFEPAGITVEYENQPWGDALIACAAGRIDAVIGASATEAAKLVVPKLDLGSPRVGLFTLKSSPWRYENLASLTKERVAVVADYKYYDALDAYIDKHKEPQVIRYSGDSALSDAIADLVAGKVDVVAEVYPVFAWTARSGGYKPEQFRLAYLHEAEPVYVAFAPTDEGRRHARLFDEGLRKLRASGKLAEILKRYGQDDWQ